MSSNQHRHKGIVYLIHFYTPFHHARHYLGWTVDLDARLHLHRTGQGSRLLAAVTAAGIAWDVVRVWRDRPVQFERELKRQRQAPMPCPVCREARRVVRLANQRRQRGLRRAV